MRAEKVEPQRVVRIECRIDWRLYLHGELPPPSRRLGPGGVEEAAPRDRDEPCLRIAWWIVRPGCQCPDQGLLHGILGRRETGAAPDEDADHRGHELPNQRLVHSVIVGDSVRNGRTSS